MQFGFFVVAHREREACQNIIGLLLAHYSTPLRATRPRERRVVPRLVRCCAQSVEGELAVIVVQDAADLAEQERAHITGGVPCGRGGGHREWERTRGRVPIMDTI
jgi:hypothetical protein